MEDSRNIAATLKRCLMLRCPACGRASVIGRPFDIKKSCSACPVIFKREEGFFVGAIMANVVATEGVILLTYFVCLLITRADQMILTILFVVGITFPLAFYHHSWALWLGLDHLIEGLPVRKGKI
ncbi:MAG TPA: hypothetical protein VJT71_16460 [Pyrinomonadaceae bacterium]|nr:hypothetical protein [Pyrinomonadaceae bacterium]